VIQVACCDSDYCSPNFSITGTDAQYTKVRARRTTASHRAPHNNHDTLAWGRGPSVARAVPKKACGAGRQTTARARGLQDGPCGLPRRRGPQVHPGGRPAAKPAPRCKPRPILRCGCCCAGATHSRKHTRRLQEAPPWRRSRALSMPKEYLWRVLTAHAQQRDSEGDAKSGCVRVVWLECAVTTRAHLTRSLVVSKLLVPLHETRNENIPARVSTRWRESSGMRRIMLAPGRFGGVLDRTERVCDQGITPVRAMSGGAESSSPLFMGRPAFMAVAITTCFARIW
jgi:hypothetical protein